MRTGRWYYTLIIRRADGWGIEFGDYDRKVVVEERRYLIEGRLDKAQDMKIIKTGDGQSEIAQAVMDLNAKEQGML